MQVTWDGVTVNDAGLLIPHAVTLYIWSRPVVLSRCRFTTSSLAVCYKHRYRSSNRFNSSRTSHDRHRGCQKSWRHFAGIFRSMSAMS